MDYESIEKEVQALIGKAASAEKSEDAIRWSQAACNAANAAACSSQASMNRGGK